MASTSISEMIFFIAALLISASVAGMLIEVVDNYASDVESTAADLKGDMQSKMSFISDNLHVPYNSTNNVLTFYLMNTGSGDLTVDDLVVSANGTTAAGGNLTKKIVGGGSRWSRGKVVEASFNVTGLKEGQDYHGWASTTGISSSSASRGHAKDAITFRVWRL